MTTRYLTRKGNDWKLSLEPDVNNQVTLRGVAGNRLQLLKSDSLAQFGDIELDNLICQAIELDNRVLLASPTSNLLEIRQLSNPANYADLYGESVGGNSLYGLNSISLGNDATRSALLWNFGTGGNRTRLFPAASVTGDREISLPDKSGIIALTSDVYPGTGGFTYDTQFVPDIPEVGATWRERAANNSIVEDWEWNGTYWLSLARYISATNQTATTVVSVTDSTPRTGSGLWLERAEVTGFVGGANNSTNFYSIGFGRYTNNATNVTDFTISTATGGPSQIFTISSVRNTFHSFGSLVAWRYGAAATGSPSGSFRFMCRYIVRIVR